MEREQLLERLRDSGVEGLAAMRAVPHDRFGAESYEQGWNVAQVMAHVASMEYTYRRLPELASTPSGTVARPDGTPFDMSVYNAKQVAKRQTAGRAELEDEFRRGRAAFVAEVDAVDPTLLTAWVRSAGGHEGALATVIDQVAVEHVRDHAGDFTRAAGASPTSGERTAAALLIAAAEVEYRLKHTSRERLLLRPAGDAWSAAGITGHLIELMPYWTASLEHLAQGSSDAEFGRSIDAPERLGAVVDGEVLSPSEAAAALDRVATDAANRIAAIPVAGWSKTITHHRYDPTSLADLADRLLAQHVREHVRQIAAALALARVD